MKETFYFPHDSNARNDEKCMFILGKYGCWAYGLYWIIIEHLHDQEDGKLTVALLDGFAQRYNIDITQFSLLYNDMIAIGLLVTDDVKFWSERVLRNKEIRKEIREKRSDAGRKGMQSRWGLEGNIDENVITNDNKPITKNNKGKERKGKERINNNTLPKNNYAEFVSLALEERQALVDKFGEESTKEMIEILDNFKGSSGKRYKSDYRAILSWVVDRWQKNQPRPTPPAPSRYDIQTQRLAQAKEAIKSARGNAGVNAPTSISQLS